MAVKFGCCGCDAIDQLRQYVDALDSRLSKLETKPCPACEPPKKTKGEEIADAMVQGTGMAHFFVGNLSIVANHRLHADHVIPQLKQRIAAAIDKAIADEREACAKAIETCCYTTVDNCQFANMLADYIRDRK